jgi:HD superfamily phosphodiesterase
MDFSAAKTFILEKLKRELPAHLSYHSVEHILDVYDAANMLAKEEGIGEEDLTLLLTAALYHDTGFLIQQKDHEKLSCDIAKEHLPSFNYSKEQIEKICGMIMATQIPQRPKNKLEEILCDADLDYLGREDFYEIGDKLFEELSVFGVLKTEEEWNKLQVRFLETHDYFTKTAVRLRKKRKEEFLAEVRSKVQSYS